MTVEMTQRKAVERAWAAAERGDTELAKAWAMIAGQLEFVPSEQQAEPVPDSAEVQYDDGLRINPIVSARLGSSE